MSNLEEAMKLYAKANKLWFEGHKGESNKLCIEACKLWNKELIRLFGFVPDFMRDISKYV